MKMGKALGLALAGGGLVLLAPAVARAGDETDVQDRILQLEKQVQELRDQQNRRTDADARPLAGQMDRYLQEQEKGALWVDKNGKPLGKVVDSIWITAWLRVRPTWSDNYTDGDDSLNDNGFVTPFRGGLGIGARLKEKVGVYIGMDFAGAWGDALTVIGNDVTTTPKIQEAYIDGLYTKHLGWDTRIGRFEMQYGDEYIIGRTDFAPATTYFDGARFSKNFEKKGFSVDVFASKLVDGFTAGPSAANPNDSVYMAGFYGNFYGSESKTGLPGGLEPYYIWIWDARHVPGAPPAPNPKDTHTGGFRWYGEKASKDKAGVGWDVNANLQYFMQLMWSTDTRVHYSMPNMKYKPKVFGQFAYASGDHDGVTGYNPLWQDGHGRFGYGDLFAFTNLAVIGGGVHVTPSENWDVGAELRSIHQARSTVLNSSKQLAWDLDFIVKHKYSENVDVEAVYSYVKMREALNGAGADADDVQRAYVQVVVSF